jgi:hypothetical protein
VPDEWIRLKHEFDAPVFGEGVATSSIEQTLDEQVRRRFIELINRASGSSKKKLDLKFFRVEKAIQSAPAGGVYADQRLRSR